MTDNMYLLVQVDVEAKQNDDDTWTFERVVYKQAKVNPPTGNIVVEENGNIYLKRMEHNPNFNKAVTLHFFLRPVQIMDKKGLDGGISFDWDKKNHVFRRVSAGLDRPDEFTADKISYPVDPRRTATGGHQAQEALFKLNNMIFVDQNDEGTFEYCLPVRVYENGDNMGAPAELDPRIENRQD